jgi:hypothetical protein
MLLDADTKGMPKAVKERINEAGGMMKAMMKVLPELAGCARLIRPSTSTGLYRTDNGTQFQGSPGWHTFPLIVDGVDIERTLKTLHDRSWLHGFGWMMVGAGGQLLNRSIVDKSVYAPERLVFEGPPVMVGAVDHHIGDRARDFRALGDHEQHFRLLGNVGPLALVVLVVDAIKGIEVREKGFFEKLVRPVAKHVRQVVEGHPLDVQPAGREERVRAMSSSSDGGRSATWRVRRHPRSWLKPRLGRAV